MLKGYLSTLMLVGLLCAACTAALAQDNGTADQAAPPPGQAAEHGGRRHFDPEERTQMLTKHLKLTSDQQPKVLDILKSEQSQMQSLRSDSSTSQEDRRTKMMEIRKTSNDQIRALLDSDQQKKWDKMQSEHGGWQGHRHGNQGSGAPDAPEPK